MFSVDIAVKSTIPYCVTADMKNKAALTIKLDRHLRKLIRPYCTSTVKEQSLCSGKGQHVASHASKRQIGKYLIYFLLASPFIILE